MAIDTEFSSLGPISFQVYMSYENNLLGDNKYEKKFIVIDCSFENYFTKNNLVKCSHDFNCEIIFDSLRDLNNSEKKLTEHMVNILLRDIPELFLSFEVLLECNLYFYFSANDLNICFGKKFMRNLYEQKKQIHYTRNYRGIINNSIKLENNLVRIKYILKDLSGINKSGLKALCKSFDIETDAKDLLNSYKTQMDLAVIEEPYLFVMYAISDVVMTYKVIFEAIKYINEILKTVFELNPNNNFTSRNIPTTVGSIVSESLNKWLEEKHFNNNQIKLALCKLNYLNESHKNYQENKVQFEKLNKIKNLNDINVCDFLNLLEPEVFKYKPFQFASCRYILDKSQNNNMYILSYVSGGRTMNCNPLNYILDCMIDIDIVGAYSSILQELEIPIGRPYYISYDINSNESMTLKSFLKRYEKKFSPFYKIVVTGNLTFEQDFIYSRIIEDKVILNKLKNKFNSESDALSTNSDFVLLRNEIRNGVITDEILNTLKKICNNSELNEFLNLKVVSAVFWDKNLKVNSLKDLAVVCMNDKKQLKFKKKVDATIDERHHYWYGIKLYDVVKNLRDKRDLYQKQKKAGLRNTVKLFLNTIYGILASQYFDLNNVVLGEIITANIRVKSYFMAKAFNCQGIITDGGPAPLEKVCKLRNELTYFKKPGIGALSQLYLKKPYLIEYISLGNLNWKELLKDPFNPPNKFDFLKDLINKHLNEFWKVYKIDITFEIEWKYLIKQGCYLSKAHYYFLTYNFEKKTIEHVAKLRGYHHSENVEFQHPLYLLMKQIAEKPEIDSFKYKNKFYLSYKIISLNSWLQIPKLQEKYLPGESYILTHEFRLNNGHLPIFNLQTFKTIKKRGLRIRKLDDFTNYKTPLFEKYLVDGIKKTFKDFMVLNNLKIKPINPMDVFETIKDFEEASKELKVREETKNKEFADYFNDKNNETLNENFEVNVEFLDENFDDNISDDNIFDDNIFIKE